MKPMTFVPISFHIVLSLILIVFFQNLHLSTSHVPGNETDHLALMSLKSRLTTESLPSLVSWNESTHFCQWIGITCGRKHQRVIEVDLSSMKLTGTLSPSVGNLSFLRVLIIDNNNLTGEILPDISRLSKLRVLSLANNSFSGKIPSNISQCLNLEIIDLGGNDLVGTIPIQFQSLSKLKLFALYLNGLTGKVPDYLGNFSQLERISLPSNNFEGNIPNTLGRLAGLKGLFIGLNYLSGAIPSSIFNLSNLVFIDIPDNKIDGSLPSDLWVMLPKLLHFSIWGNRFTGLIPKSLSNASQLVHLDISENGFTGVVPLMNGLQNLGRFACYENLLGNNDEGDLEFFSLLRNSTKLQVLVLYKNNLGGTFPKSVGNLSNLVYLGTNDNPIYGKIPNDIGELQKLQTLGMGNSKLTGGIPSSIGNLQELRQLSFRGSNLSGRIPHSIGNLTKLFTLYLGLNNFEGSIPSTFTKFRSLSSLDLSGNNLSSNIPSEIFSIPSLTLLLDLSNNHFVGPLVMVLGPASRNLNYFRVSNNLLFGELPSNLGSYESLNDLLLDGNSFQGEIPPSLRSLRALEVLDLSRNNFSGKIPEYIGQFPFMSNLNLSFNNFDGAVPVEGVFSNTKNFSIEGNNKLCGGVQQLNLPICDMKEGVSKKFSSSRGLKYIIPISIGILVLILMFLSIFVYKRRHGRKVSTSDALARNAFPQVSYRDLYKATNGFSSTNLCGSGKFSSVYKGVLGLNESIVAVKVLKLEVGGAEKSFMSECVALRSVRHKNLVKILTSCSTIDFQGNDFKALVYAFMENGSLEEWLHHNSMSLTLSDRLNIVIDVASALDYLHNQTGKSMVHCDVKPSNVLLNGDMVAHLGDFGLLKFLQVPTSDVSSTSHTSSIGIKGTIGYAAPEYGLGSEISTYGDMYSFGILILEIFSGKRPTDSMFTEGLNLHNFVAMAVPDRVMDISDSQLFPTEDELQQSHGNSETQNYTVHERISEFLALIFRIGVSCSVDLPRERMTIKDAIHELHLIKKSLQENIIVNQEDGNLNSL